MIYAHVCAKFICVYRIQFICMTKVKIDRYDQVLTFLEDKFLGYTNSWMSPELPLEGRIERLEKDMLGDVLEGDATERIKRLWNEQKYADPFLVSDVSDDVSDDEHTPDESSANNTAEAEATSSEIVLEYDRISEGIMRERLRMLWRRKWWFVLAAVLFCLGVALLVLLDDARIGLAVVIGGLSVAAFAKVQYQIYVS